MRIPELSLRNITFAVAFILAVIGIALSSTGAARTAAAPADDQASSLAAWTEIATVLQNPALPQLPSTRFSAARRFAPGSCSSRHARPG